jgi:colicin import membrane protein
MTDATPYTVPKEPGRWRALTFAALVHAALFAFLWIGVRWQNDTPATIEAEVWSPQPREAAPLPEPPKEPEPQPVVKSTPEPKVIEQPPAVKPDIALEQEKKRKAQEEKKRDEEQRQAKEKKRIEEEKLAKLKQEDAKRLEKEKADKAKKDVAEKKRKQDEADEKIRAKAHDEEMRRIAGGVTGTGGTGDAAKSQGGRSDGGYLQRIAARIKSHTVFNVPDGLAGNPAVEYAIELLPDGSLRGTPRKLKSSNVQGFDEAVLRAIDKSQPFPRDEKTGNVPSRITVSHQPKDQ